MLYFSPSLPQKQPMQALHNLSHVPRTILSKLKYETQVLQNVNVFVTVPHVGIAYIKCCTTYGTTCTKCCIRPKQHNWWYNAFSKLVILYYINTTYLWYVRGKLKKLRAEGVGATSKNAEPFTKEEENKLWKSGVMGTDSPQALLKNNALLRCW